MKNLFLISMIIAQSLPQNQNLPDAFYQIPEPVRETATVVVLGTYAQGRTPCMFLPDGSRVWGLDSGFNIKRAYRGKVSSRFIRVNTAMLPKTRYVSNSLKRGQEYVVLLRPGKEKMEQIGTKEGVGFWDALSDEDVIAIVESK
jgi:hypothetical protein